MKFRGCAAVGVSLALILTTANAFGQIPKTNSSFSAVESIHKEKLPVKLKFGEKVILKQQQGKHTWRIITNMREILILDGSVKGVLEKTNVVKAYEKSKDGNYLFMLRENGTLMVFDNKNKAEYGYENAKIIEAIRGKKFTSGNCGDWTYFISTDNRSVIWLSMNGTTLNFFVDNLQIAEHKKVEMVTGKDCLDIYVDGEMIRTLTPPN